MGWRGNEHTSLAPSRSRFGIATHRRYARLVLISKLIIERNNVWFYNVRIFWDHSLLRTFVLSRPYVSLKQKSTLFILRKYNAVVCVCSRKCYLKITFSISIDRRPSEWLGGSRDLISSRIRDSVIPGDVRSADSKALRSSSTAPPFLPPLPPSPLLSLAEYWCFRWSCNIIESTGHFYKFSLIYIFFIHLTFYIQYNTSESRGKTTPDKATLRGCLSSCELLGLCLSSQGLWSAIEVMGTSGLLFLLFSRELKSLLDLSRSLPSLSRSRSLTTSLSLSRLSRISFDSLSVDSRLESR